MIYATKVVGFGRPCLNHLHLIQVRLSTSENSLAKYWSAIFSRVGVKAGRMVCAFMVFHVSLIFIPEKNETLIPPDVHIFKWLNHQPVTGG
jgi:hypothetical protein